LLRDGVLGVRRDDQPARPREGRTSPAARQDQRMTAAAIVRTVAATTHGRYLVMEPEGRAAGVVVGFHGYGENAEIHLDALRAIPGAGRWLLVAVQALHPFYTRDERIVAGWMTRRDRELA